MINDEIPQLPHFSEEDLDGYRVEYAVKELSSAQNILIFYENREGTTRIIFDRLSAPLYACMVAKLSHPENNKIYEYLKLVVHAVHQMKKCSKKGQEVGAKIESYIDKKY
jgi:hypothetical protein